MFKKNKKSGKALLFLLLALTLAAGIYATRAIAAGPIGTAEIEDCVVDELTARLEKRFDVRVHSHMLEFYGECADCVQNAD